MQPVMGSIKVKGEVRAEELCCNSKCAPQTKSRLFARLDFIFKPSTRGSSGVNSSSPLGSLTICADLLRAKNDLRSEEELKFCRDGATASI